MAAYREQIFTKIQP